MRPLSAAGFTDAGAALLLLDALATLVAVGGTAGVSVGAAETNFVGVAEAEPLDTAPGVAVTGTAVGCPAAGDCSGNTVPGAGGNPTAVGDTIGAVVVGELHAVTTPNTITLTDIHIITRIKLVLRKNILPSKWESARQK